jgi:hypothetical protein
MENGADSGTVDAGVEARAIANVVEAFRPLDPAAIRRVLEWAFKRYAGAALTEGAGASLPAAARADDLGADRHVGDIADLYTAANPRTEAESVLVAAYWRHVTERTDALDSQTLNRDLKHLGRGVANVTRACSVLIQQRPALMLQVKKSGSTKQARKQYRLTAAGVQRAREMLAERGGTGRRGSEDAAS